MPDDLYGLNAPTRAMVLDILDGSGFSKMNFTFSGIKITHSILLKVATAIRNGYINVIFDPSLSGAEYRSTSDELRVPFSFISRSSQKALVVHEATHAALDCASLSSKQAVRVVDSEAVAYIAQQIYTYSKWGEYISGSGLGADKFTVAAELAATISANPGHVCDWWEIFNMRAAVMKDPEYGTACFAQQASYMGV